MDDRRPKSVVFLEKFASYCMLIVFFCSLPLCLFHLFFYRALVIGPSMQPTFNVNLKDDDDYLNSIYKDVVVVYRYDKGSCGDIILCKYNGETLVKRLIALPCQKITLRQNGLTDTFSYYIDDEKISEPYLKENALAMNTQYYFLFCETFGLAINGGEASIIVPEGKAFILGDNRAKSKDSHLFGFVNLDDFEGKVSFYYRYDQNLFTYLLSEIGKWLGIV